MIDLHSHILPGLDDGSRSMEESVEMVRIAAAAGTTDLVATPHANLDFRFDPEVVERKIAELGRASGGAVRLHYGCDFHFYFDNLQDAIAHPTRYAIRHRNYLLVEFPEILIPSATDQAFSRLLDAGLVPVITHPERNFLLHARLSQLEAWAGRGIRMQLTAQSLLGRFGPQVRRFSEELLRRGLVHFISSDAHDPKDRPPRLDTAFEVVERQYGKQWAELLFIDNPRCALEGAPLPEQPPPPPPRKKWFEFWRKAEGAIRR